MTSSSQPEESTPRTPGRDPDLGDTPNAEPSAAQPTPSTRAISANDSPHSEPNHTESDLGEVFKDRTFWKRAVATAGASYGCALVAAFLSLAGLGDLQKMLTSVSGASLGFITANPAGMVFTLVAMAFGGQLTISIAAAGQAVIVSVGFAPLLVCASALAVAWGVAREKGARRGDSATLPAAEALAAALLFATLTVLFPSLIPPLSFQMGTLASASAGAASAQGFLVALLLMWVTVFAARGGFGLVPRDFGRLLPGLATFMIIGLILGLVEALIGFTSLGVPPVITSAWPVTLPAATVWALGVNTFSALVVSSGAGATPQSFSVMTPGIGTQFVIIILLSAVIIAYLTAVALTCARAIGGPLDIAKCALVWAVAGFGVQLYSSFSVGTAISSASAAGPGSVSVGLALSTPVVWGIWGAALGALALWFGPNLAAWLPRSLRRPFNSMVPQGQNVGLSAGPQAESEALGSTSFITHPHSASRVDAFSAGDGAVATHRATVASGAKVAPPAPRTTSTPVPRGPLTRRAAGVLTGLSLATALLLGALSAVPLIKNTFYSPAAVAREYFAALEAGEASRAMSLGGMQAASGLSSDLLTDGIYKAAVDRPSQAAVKSTTVSGDTATVVVSYHRGGVVRASRLSLNRIGSSFGIADDWRIVGGQELERIALQMPEDAAARTVVVNGVTLNRARQTVTFAVLPGTYNVEARPTTWMDGASAPLISSSTVNGALAASSTLALESSPSKALQQAVADAVNAKIRACSNSSKVYQPECPFSVGFASSTGISNVKYDVTTFPTYNIRPGEGSGEWNIYTQSSGSVNETYTESYAFGAPQQRSTVSGFAVSAVASVGDAGVTVTKMS